jgi:lipoprotein NlpI
MDDFDQAIKLNPQNVNAYFNRGLVKSRLEDWDGAIADFTQTIALDSSNAGAYFYRGYIKARTGDSDGAITDYTHAIRIEPKRAEFYGSRGLAKASQRDLDGAIADYNRAIEIYPKGASFFSRRGRAKADVGDLDGAIADFTRYIELDPKDADAYLSRALAKYQNGDPDGAMADCTRAIDLKPVPVDARTSQVHSLLGRLKFDRGDLTGAIADFDQAIKLTPADAVPYVDRGVANYVNNCASPAIQDFQRAAELHFTHSDCPRIFTWLVKAEKAGQRPLANQELKDYFLTRGTGTNDWPFQIGRFLTGELSQSDFLKAAGSTDPKTDKEQHCEAYFYTGIKLSYDGNVTLAKSFFQQCIATDVKRFYEYRMARIKLKTLEGEK